MSQRFFVDHPITGTQVQLTGDEAHHLVRVMRVAVGDVFWLFDGSGTDFEGRIVAKSKQAVEFEVLSSRPGRMAVREVTIAVALPKGDRQHWLVEKLTELGVAKLIPLASERSVANPDAAAERMRRWMIEASKQCERSRLMEIAPPCSISELAAMDETDVARYVAHPSGGSISSADSNKLLIAIGPEGGFTDAEVSALISAGFAPISLGPHILRVETAAIAAAAILGLR